MNFDNEGAVRKTVTKPATTKPVDGRDCRNLSVDEVKRQLGMNLIEAARHFDDVQVSLARYRR